MIRPLQAANKNAGRALLIPLLFLSLATAAYSQDKIITQNNDTIDCRIIRVSRNTIYFDLITSGIRTSGSLPLNSVQNYFFSAGTIAGEEGITGITSGGRLQFEISAGPGYLTAGTKEAREVLVSQGAEPGRVQSYYKNLKTGWNAGAGLTYMITPEMGMGIRYKFFCTSGNLKGFFDPQDGVHLLYGNYGEKISVNYYGSSLSYHLRPGSQKLFLTYVSYSLGMVTYRNEAEYINNYLLFSGRNLGIDVSAGLEYFISDNLSVVAGLSSFLSTLRKLKVTDGTNSTSIKLEKENYENLSRIEFLLGVRLYFWNK